MAMAAIGLSTNLKDIKKMGYKPFVVGYCDDYCWDILYFND